MTTFDSPLKAYEHLLVNPHSTHRDEAEQFIFQDAPTSYRYCKYVLGDKHPEAERIILTDPRFACFYAIDLIKGRWFEAEPIIKNSAQYYEYYLDQCVHDQFLKHWLFFLWTKNLNKIRPIPTVINI